MAKIHILGGPGSGKSTLAQALSTRLNVPHHDLDIIGQKNGTNATAHITTMRRARPNVSPEISRQGTGDLGADQQRLFKMLEGQK